jgi:hypothetical protein
MFDNYSLKARYYPVIILFLPIVVLGFFYSQQFESVFHFLGSVGVVGALTYLFSQLGRDQGKRKEFLLWNSWGGAPTIQLMRFQNSYLDTHTKHRYHQKLHQLCSASVSPNVDLETNYPEKADDIYRAWTKYLISQTRDTKKFSLLYKENINYGFRRNLWGLRSFAIFLAVGLLICNYLFWSLKLNEFNPALFPKSFLYSSIGIGLIIIFWLLIVNKNWVKLVAFSYAERLCECVDNL